MARRNRAAEADLSLAGSGAGPALVMRPQHPALTPQVSPKPKSAERTKTTRPTAQRAAPSSPPTAVLGKQGAARTPAVKTRTPTAATKVTESTKPQHATVPLASPAPTATGAAAQQKAKAPAKHLMDVPLPAASSPNPTPCSSFSIHDTLSPDGSFQRAHHQVAPGSNSESPPTLSRSTTMKSSYTTYPSFGHGSVASDFSDYADLEEAQMAERSSVHHPPKGHTLPLGSAESYSPMLSFLPSTGQMRCLTPQAASSVRNLGECSPALQQAMLNAGAADSEARAEWERGCNDEAMIMAGHPVPMPGMHEPAGGTEDEEDGPSSDEGPTEAEVMRDALGAMHFSGSFTKWIDPEPQPAAS